MRREIFQLGVFLLLWNLAEGCSINYLPRVAVDFPSVAEFHCETNQVKLGLNLKSWIDFSIPNYSYCIGTDWNQCDLVPWTSIPPGQSSASFWVTGDQYIFISGRGTNCFGTGPIDRLDPYLVPKATDPSSFSASVNSWDSTNDCTIQGNFRVSSGVSGIHNYTWCFENSRGNCDIISPRTFLAGTNQQFSVNFTFPSPLESLGYHLKVIGRTRCGVARMPVYYSNDYSIKVPQLSGSHISIQSVRPAYECVGAISRLRKTFNFGSVFLQTIQRYSYCVGTSPQSCDVIASTQTTSTSVILALLEDVNYFFNVNGSNCRGTTTYSRQFMITGGTIPSTPLSISIWQPSRSDCQNPRMELFFSSSWSESDFYQFCIGTTSDCDLFPLQRTDQSSFCTNLSRCLIPVSFNTTYRIRAKALNCKGISSPFLPTQTFTTIVAPFNATSPNRTMSDFIVVRRISHMSCSTASVILDYYMDDRNVDYYEVCAQKLGTTTCNNSANYVQRYSDQAFFDVDSNSSYTFFLRGVNCWGTSQWTTNTSFIPSTPNVVLSNYDFNVTYDYLDLFRCSASLRFSIAYKGPGMDPASEFEICVTWNNQTRCANFSAGISYFYGIAPYTGTTLVTFQVVGGCSRSNVFSVNVPPPSILLEDLFLFINSTRISFLCSSNSPALVQASISSNGFSYEICIGNSSGDCSIVPWTQGLSAIVPRGSYRLSVRARSCLGTTFVRDRTIIVEDDSNFLSTPSVGSSGYFECSNRMVTLASNWGNQNGNLGGLSHFRYFEYSISSSNGSLVNWKPSVNNNTLESFILPPQSLSTYFIQVRGYNCRGDVSESGRSSLTLDTRSPDPPQVGLNEFSCGTDINQVNARVVVSQSGRATLTTFCLGTTRTLCDIANWVNVTSSSVDRQISIPRTIQTVFLRARHSNCFGTSSESVTSAQPVISIPSSPNIDFSVNNFNCEANTVSLSISSSGSSLQEICIGTSFGSCNLQRFNATGNAIPSLTVPIPETGKFFGSAVAINCGLRSVAGRRERNVPSFFAPFRSDPSITISKCLRTGSWLFSHPTNQISGYDYCISNSNQVCTGTIISTTSNSYSTTNQTGEYLLVRAKNCRVTSPWFSSERNLNFEFLNLQNVQVSLQTCPNAARFSASGSASESILYCYGTGVGLCDLSNTSSQFVVTQPGSYFVSARLATPNCNGQTLSVNSTTPYVVSSQFLNSSTDFTLRGSVSLSLDFSSPSCGINQLRISTGSQYFANSYWCLRNQSQTCQPNQFRIIYSSSWAASVSQPGTYVVEIYSEYNQCGVTNRTNTLVSPPLVITSTPRFPVYSWITLNSLRVGCNSSILRGDLYPPMGNSWRICLSQTLSCPQNGWRWSLSNNPQFQVQTSGVYNLLVEVYQDGCYLFNGSASFTYTASQSIPGAVSSFSEQIRYNCQTNMANVRVYNWWFSGIVESYSYCIGTQSGTCNIRPLTTTVSNDVSVDLSPGAYFFSFSATNCRGSTPLISLRPTVVSTIQAPQTPSVSLRFSSTRDYCASSVQILGSISGSLSPVTLMQNNQAANVFNYAVGSLPFSADILNWANATSQAPLLSVPITSFPLFLSASGINCAGRGLLAASSQLVLDYTVQAFEPSDIQIYSFYEQDQNSDWPTCASRKSIYFCYRPATSHKYVEASEYCLGTSAGSCNVFDWTRNGSGSLCTQFGNISPGAYFVNVRYFACNFISPVVSQGPLLVSAPVGSPPSIVGSLSSSVNQNPTCSNLESRKIGWLSVFSGAQAYDICIGNDTSSCNFFFNSNLTQSSVTFRVNHSQTHVFTVTAINCAGRSSPVTLSFNSSAAPSFTLNSLTPATPQIYPDLSSCGRNAAFQISWSASVTGSIFGYAICIGSTNDTCDSQFFTGSTSFYRISGIGTFFARVRVVGCRSESNWFYFAPIVISASAVGTPQILHFYQDRAATCSRPLADLYIRLQTYDFGSYCIGSTEMCDVIPWTPVISSAFVVVVAPNRTYTLYYNASICGILTSTSQNVYATPISPPSLGWVSIYFDSRSCSDNATIEKLSWSSGVNNDFSYYCIGFTEGGCEILPYQYAGPGITQVPIGIQVPRNKWYFANVRPANCLGNSSLSFWDSEWAPSKTTIFTSLNTVFGFFQCGSTSLPVRADYSISNAQYYQFCLSSSNVSDSCIWSVTTSSSTTVNVPVGQTYWFFVAAQIPSDLDECVAPVIRSNPIIASASPSVPNPNKLSSWISSRIIPCGARIQASWSYSTTTGDFPDYYLYCFGNSSGDCSISPQVNTTAHLTPEISLNSSRTVFLSIWPGNCAGISQTFHTRSQFITSQQVPSVNSISASFATVAGPCEGGNGTITFCYNSPGEWVSFCLSSPNKNCDIIPLTNSSASNCVTRTVPANVTYTAVLQTGNCAGSSANTTLSERVGLDSDPVPAPFPFMSASRHFCGNSTTSITASWGAMPKALKYRYCFQQPTMNCDITPLTDTTSLSVSATVPTGATYEFRVSSVNCKDIVSNPAVTSVVVDQYTAPTNTFAGIFFNEILPPTCYQFDRRVSISAGPFWASTGRTFLADFYDLCVSSSLANDCNLFQLTRSPTSSWTFRVLLTSSYYFAVRGGNCLGWSDWIYRSALDIPVEASPPTVNKQDLTIIIRDAVCEDQSANRALVTWGTPKFDTIEYSLCVGNTTGGCEISALQSTSSNGLTVLVPPGTGYFFRLRARNCVGEGNWTVSDPIDALINCCPDRCNGRGDCIRSRCQCYFPFYGDGCLFQYTAPVLQSGSIAVLEFQPFTFDVTVISSDPFPTSWFIQSDELGVQLNDVTGRISWTSTRASFLARVLPYRVVIGARNLVGSSTTTILITIRPSWEVQITTTEPRGTPIIAARQNLIISGIATRLPDQTSRSLSVPVEVFLRNTRTGGIKYLRAETLSFFGFVLSYFTRADDAGYNEIGAIHPGMRGAEGLNATRFRFGVVTMALEPASVQFSDFPPNVTKTVTARLSNPSEIPLTGISVKRQGGLVTLQLNYTGLPTELGPLETKEFQISFLADFAMPTTWTETFAFVSDINAVAFLSVTIPQHLPILQFSQSSMRIAVRLGNPRLFEVNLQNQGGADAIDIYLSTPVNFPWFSLSTSPNVPRLASGQFTTVILSVNPFNVSTSLEYSGRIVATGKGESGDPVLTTLSFTVLFISDTLGSITIRTTDEFTYFADGSPSVGGASVRLIDPRLSNTVQLRNSDPVFARATQGSVIATGITGPNGTVTFENIPEGQYYIEASSPTHEPFTDVVNVAPGVIKNLDAFMHRNDLVKVTWNVFPTTIQDEITFEVEADFRTNVPAPVVTCFPLEINLIDVATEIIETGGPVIRSFNVTNHGLIAAKKLTLTLPQDSGFHFQILNPNEDDLPARSSRIYLVSFNISEQGYREAELLDSDEAKRDIPEVVSRLDTRVASFKNKRLAGGFLRWLLTRCFNFYIRFFVECDVLREYGVDIRVWPSRPCEQIELLILEFLDWLSQHFPPAGPSCFDNKCRLGVPYGGGGGWTGRPCYDGGGDDDDGGPPGGPDNRDGNPGNDGGPPPGPPPPPPPCPPPENSCPPEDENPPCPPEQPSDPFRNDTEGPPPCPPRNTDVTTCADPCRPPPPDCENPALCCPPDGPPFYNETTGRCECPDGRVWNETTEECDCKPPSVWNENCKQCQFYLHCHGAQGAKCLSLNQDEKVPRRLRCGLDVVGDAPRKKIPGTSLTWVTCIGDPHFFDHNGWHMMSASLGSLYHDHCCGEYPNGVFCDPPTKGNDCAGEWGKATSDFIWNFVWPIAYNIDQLVPEVPDITIWEQVIGRVQGPFYAGPGLTNRQKPRRLPNLYPILSPIHQFLLDQLRPYSSAAVCEIRPFNRYGRALLAPDGTPVDKDFGPSVCQSGTMFEILDQSYCGICPEEEEPEYDDPCHVPVCVGIRANRYRGIPMNIKLVYQILVQDEEALPDMFEVMDEFYELFASRTEAGDRTHFPGNYVPRMAVIQNRDTGDTFWGYQGRVAWKGDPIDPELRKKVNRLLLEERKAPTKDNVCSKNYDPKDVAYNVPFWETVSAAEFSAINEAALWYGGWDKVELSKFDITVSYGCEAICPRILKLFPELTWVTAQGQNQKKRSSPPPVCLPEDKFILPTSTPIISGGWLYDFEPVAPADQSLWFGDPIQYRIKKASGPLTPSTGWEDSEPTPMWRKTGSTTRLFVRFLGYTWDQAGHIRGGRFGGSGKTAVNIFPQTWDQNNKEYAPGDKTKLRWKGLEYRIKKFVYDDKWDAELEISFIYLSTPTASPSTAIGRREVYRPTFMEYCVTFIRTSQTKLAPGYVDKHGHLNAYTQTGKACWDFENFQSPSGPDAAVLLRLAEHPFFSDGDSSTVP